MIVDIKWKDYMTHEIHTLRLVYKVLINYKICGQSNTKMPF